MLRIHVIAATCGAALLGGSLAGIVSNGASLAAAAPEPPAHHACHGHGL
jgi:hypothetical protein